MENSNNEFGFEMSEAQMEFVNVCRQYNRNGVRFDSDFVWQDDGEDREFEDDGLYHVCRNGVRVAFDVDQWASERVQENRCRQVAEFVRREYDSR